MRPNNTKKLIVGENFFYSLALLPLTPCEYKCILTLLEYGECTQIQLSNKLDIARQNINKAINHLEKLGVIEKMRIEGRNIFFCVNTNFEIHDFDKNQLLF